MHFPMHRRLLISARRTATSTSRLGQQPHQHTRDAIEQKDER
jgi:hypothetical protein